MDPRPALWLAGAVALPTAWLATTCLPAATALAAAATVVALLSRHPARLGGTAALPMLLAAASPPAPAVVCPEPGPVRLAGCVRSVSYAPAYDHTAIELANARDDRGRTLRLSCVGRIAALPGDRLTAVGRLRSGVAPAMAPTLHTNAAAVRVEPAPASLPRLLAAARRTAEQALLGLVPGDRGAVLATLVLGRATRPPAEIAAAHRGTGLSHLLAVSGAHAAMLGFMLGLGGFGSSPRSRGRRLGNRRLHVGAALLLLFAYAGITGGEPPVLRAVIMYALAALALRVGRPLGLLAGLLVPALVTAATSPTALLGPSFLLSYAAVIGLAMTAPARRGWPDRWLRAPLAASFWATCTTAPITLFWFGQVAPWTILLTPLLAPLIAVALLLGLLAAAAASTAPALAAPFGPVLDALVATYLAIVSAADGLPGTPIRAVCAPTPLFAALGVVTAMALLALANGRRRVVFASLAVMSPWFVALPADVAPRLRVFAVGHGQAALLSTADGHHVAIDCGSLQIPQRAARQLGDALPIYRLDWLVVTHADADHHNGVPWLLSRVRVERALLHADLRESELCARLRADGAAIRFLAGGERARLLPGLEVAAPRLPAATSPNDRSLWTRIELLGTRVLLPGDAEALGIAAGLAQGLAQPADVLVLPHHGRDNPAGAALLQRVRPRCCLASAAAADGETALGELARRRGAELWVTGQHGDLELRFGTPSRLSGSTGARALPR